MKNNKYLTSAALIGLSMFSVGQASAKTVDGISFNSGSAVFEIASVFEDKVVNIGDTLSGLGKMTNIFASDATTTTWSDGNNGRELTYTFGGFTLEAVIPASFGGGATLLFSGGSASFYSDATQDFTVTSGNKATDVASASNGTSWLTGDAGVVGTCAVANGCLNGVGTGITLISTVNSTSLGAVTSGSGLAFFDVTGGNAALDFNTNGLPGGFDFKANFSFDSILPTDFDLSGSADIRTFSVPEPSSIALLGLGLLGFVSISSRKKNRV